MKRIGLICLALALLACIALPASAIIGVEEPPAPTCFRLVKEENCGGDGNPYSKTVRTYDDGGRVLTEEEFDLNGNNELVLSYVTEYTYDEQGRVLTGIAYIYNNSGVREPHTKLTYAYGDNTRTEIYHFWENDAWVASNKNVKTYNDNGNEILSMRYIMNMMDQWCEDSKMVTVYDGKTKTMTAYDFDGTYYLTNEYIYVYSENAEDVGENEFCVSYRSTSYDRSGVVTGVYGYENSEFDEHGNYTLFTGYDFDWITKQVYMSYQYKYEYTYDEDGNITEEIIYHRYSESDPFVGQNKYTCTYNEDGRYLTWDSFEWDTDKFIPSYHEEYTYGDDGTVTCVSMHYNTVTGEFEFTGKDERSENTYGMTVFYRSFNYNTVIEKWVPSNSGTFDYDVHHLGLRRVAAQLPTEEEDGWRAYYECTYCGYCFEDSEGTHLIRNVEQWKKNEGALKFYKVISGNHTRWNMNAKQNITFSTDIPFDQFRYVEVDSGVLSAENYTVTNKNGNVSVTLNAAYVATLASGDHVIGIFGQDGAASAVFAMSTIGPFGDNANVALWISLTVLSAAALCGTVVAVRKKEMI